MIEEAVMLPNMSIPYSWNQAAKKCYQEEMIIDKSIKKYNIVLTYSFVNLSNWKLIILYNPVISSQFNLFKIDNKLYFRCIFMLIRLIY